MGIACWRADVCVDDSAYQGFRSAPNCARRCCALLVNHVLSVLYFILAQSRLLFTRDFLRRSVVGCFICEHCFVLLNSAHMLLALRCSALASKYRQQINFLHARSLAEVTSMP